MTVISKEKVVEISLDDEYDQVSEIVDGITDPKIADPIRALLSRLTERVKHLEDEGNIHDLQSEAHGATDAINRFLDVVGRPCGTRKFIIPETGKRDRALIGLYDAIGRRL